MSLNVSAISPFIPVRPIGNRTEKSALSEGLQSGEKLAIIETGRGNRRSAGHPRLRDRHHHFVLGISGIPVAHA